MYNLRKIRCTSSGLTRWHGGSIVPIEAFDPVLSALVPVYLVLFDYGVIPDFGLDGVSADNLTLFAPLENVRPALSPYFDMSGVRFNHSGVSYDPGLEAGSLDAYFDYTGVGAITSAGNTYLEDAILGNRYLILVTPTQSPQFAPGGFSAVVDEVHLPLGFKSVLEIDKGSNPLDGFDLARATGSVDLTSFFRPPNLSYPSPALDNYLLYLTK